MEPPLSSVTFFPAKLALTSLILSQAFCSVLPAAQQNEGKVIRWDESLSYADHLLYNGQRYKTIQIKDRIYVWASLQHTRASTLANIIVVNQSEGRIDVDPEEFTCVCLGKKPKILRYHWPFGVPTDPNSHVLRANTIMPGEDVKGIVSFQLIRKCDSAIVQVPISGTTFEFPFP